MTQTPKYLRVGPTRKSDHGFQWVLIVALLALLSWIWWQNRQPAKPKPTAKAVALPALVLTNRPAPAIATKSALPVPSFRSTNVVKSVKEPVTDASTVAEKILEAQLNLVRHGISSGSLDGVMGSQTRAALRAFQRKENLPVTGTLDDATQLHLGSGGSSYTSYAVTAEDLGRLQPLGKTWLNKSQQDRLDYETVLEMVSEKHHANPTLIRRLNPAIDWDNVVVGTILKVPNAERPPASARAASVKIYLAQRVLEAFDESDRLLAHFPCSIAQRVEKRPVGELHVAVIAPNPNYTFNPEIFPESAEARELGRKLILHPGPNNPVGTVWIGLDKSGYGIHGTPRPEDVGRTESHGCFRLANWNAEYLLQLVQIGTPVFVEP